MTRRTPEALAALADLQFDDQQWADAAETLIRRARAEKSRTALKDIFFKLGIIYSEHLPDPKRAVASFTRVLQVTPDDIIALEHLSNLHVKEWEWKGALQATMRLAGLETRSAQARGAPAPRRQDLRRGLQGRAPRARRAARRHGDRSAATCRRSASWPSSSIASPTCSRCACTSIARAARVRQQLDANPMEPASYHALFRIYGWRRAPDRAAFAAGTLEWLGAADADEKAMLAKLTGRDNYPGSSLADPTLDETLFDARVPAGFRNLFRLLDEPLAKMFRADVKRLGVGRHEKLPRSGHALRDVANKIAADLGVRDFDLYVTAAHPTALVVELTDPLSIVIGNKVIEGAHELELRFLLGRCFKMIQSHMALPMRLTPEDLGLLVGGIVRQFVPDFVPAGFDEAQIVAEAGRMAKHHPEEDARRAVAVRARVRVGVARPEADRPVAGAHGQPRRPARLRAARPVADGGAPARATRRSCARCCASPCPTSSPSCAASSAPPSADGGAGRRRLSCRHGHRKCGRSDPSLLM